MRLYINGALFADDVRQGTYQADLYKRGGFVGSLKDGNVYDRSGYKIADERDDEIIVK